MKSPKILIAVPCLETIDVVFVQSVLAMDKVGDVRLEFLPGNLIYVARDILAAMAVEFGTDYVLWLDSDMVFPSDIMQSLMAHSDREIISALYFRRAAPFNPVLFKKVNIRNRAEDPASVEYDDYPANTLFTAEGIGFGCVLTKTSILAEMFDKYGTCFEPIHSLGEDVSFCQRARELGHDVWCHSGIQVGHRYMSISDENTFRAFQELKKRSQAK